MLDYVLDGQTGNVCISDQSNLSYYEQPIQVLFATILVH